MESYTASERQLRDSEDDIHDGGENCINDGGENCIHDSGGNFIHAGGENCINAGGELGPWKWPGNEQIYGRFALRKARCPEIAVYPGRFASNGTKWPGNMGNPGRFSCG